MPSHALSLKRLAPSINEGTAATLSVSRTYEWVRSSMTRERLPGTRWHVGHMTGRGAGPEDKARNLMAQTAKDNSGPGGLFSKQMTAAEAAFYARKLTTCAELEKQEL